MKMLESASDELSKLDLTIRTDHFLIEVLWFRTMRKKDDWIIKNHKHHSFEFHFCAEGGSKVILEELDFEIKSGEFYLTTPGVYHEQVNNLCDNYLEYSLNCNITLLDANQSEGQLIHKILRESKPKIYSCKKIVPLFEESLSEALNKEVGYYNKILSLLTMILIESTRVIKSDSDYEVPKKYKDYDFRYNQIYNFIIDNINNQIKIEDISDYIHLSSKQINRIVISNAQMSTKKLINEIRINKSKDLLIQTNRSITEIMESVGISSVYYFCQFFKRYEGISPTEYRKMSRKLK